MRAELAHMLGHRSLARWSPDATVAMANFDRLSWAHPTPVAQAPAGLRCSDADDQVFIDLALAERAQWLLTHDRALLKLARRAAALGLRIVRPADWAAQT
jgi:predicted nucleic acid-binding protein